MEQQEQLSGKQGIVFIQEQMNFEMEKFMFLRQDLERVSQLYIQDTNVFSLAKNVS